jgi:hypothetical protein
MNMRTMIVIILSTILLPSAAYAHGEEIVLFWGIEAIVLSIMIFIAIFFKRKIKYFCILGLFVGWIIGWAITWNMYYYTNAKYILSTHLIFPFIGLIISAVLFRFSRGRNE